MKPIRIPFNRPLVTGGEAENIQDVLRTAKTAGDGTFTARCQQWLSGRCGTHNALLSTSCTAALEIAALLLNLIPGDEVIMPSYTFVSSANAFALRGAVPVFVDIRPDTMNIDETKIADAITPRTRAIVPVHYGGVACEMDTILSIAKTYNLAVIEDAAQAVRSSYKGLALGAIGDMGCLSFHETKNLNCGEGGALLVNNKSFLSRAEIIREKGTNRSRFLRGEVDKYTWVDLGSSYLTSELNAAFLFAQLQRADAVTAHRLALWNRYHDQLSDQNKVTLPAVPSHCNHNGHIFYIKTRTTEERSELMKYLQNAGVDTATHYVPLHTAEAGLRLSRFHGDDIYTTSHGNRLLRLPMFYSLQPKEVDRVCDLIKRFYREQGGNSDANLASV